MPKIYPFVVEFKAEFGMFARGDTGSEPTSYELPTASNARGMIEAICRIKGSEIEPVATGICSRPQWLSYTCNSYSPHRKSNQINDGNPCQIRANILQEPHFVVIGLIHSLNKDIPNHLGINHAHACSDILSRKIKSGRAWTTPCMGWSDFPVTDYIAQETPIYAYNSILPTFLSITYDNNGRVIKNCRQNVPIENGVIHYGGNEKVIIKENGMITFANSELSEMLDRFIRKTTRTKND